MLTFNSIDNVTDWKWPHFLPAEIACKGTGRIVFDEATLDKLEILRNQLGFALPVSSGYRAPEYNNKVSGTGLTGPHTTGKAIDLSVVGLQAYKVMEAAIALGFTGIGVNQKGTGRFIHIDTLSADKDQPRPWVWSY